MINYFLSKVTRTDCKNCYPFWDATKCAKLAEKLKNLGYKVILNLMQAHPNTDEDYFNVVTQLNDFKLFDVLYFADSLGNMMPEDVTRISSIYVSIEELGIHTHNNKSLAR